MPALPRSPPSSGPLIETPLPTLPVGFLWPFPVSESVLGTGAEGKAEQEQRCEEPTRANGVRAWGVLKEGKNWGPGDPHSSSFRPSGRSLAISRVSSQELRSHHSPPPRLRSLIPSSLHPNPTTEDLIPVDQIKVLV